MTTLYIINLQYKNSIVDRVNRGDSDTPSGSSRFLS